MDKVRTSCTRGANGNSTNLISVFAEYDKQQTSPSQLMQESYARKNQSHHNVRTPAQAHVRNLVSRRAHNIDGKTWRAELVSNTIHDSTVSTTESHRHIEETATGQSLKDVNRLVRAGSL